LIGYRVCQILGMQIIQVWSRERVKARAHVPNLFLFLRVRESA